MYIYFDAFVNTIVTTKRLILPGEYLLTRVVNTRTSVYIAYDFLSH